MFTKLRDRQFAIYNEARTHFIAHPQELIQLEREVSGSIFSIVRNHFTDFERDYNEASYLYPFWQNYPPEERGRKPVGDQYPWLEVGENVFGGKFPRLLQERYEILDSGIPSGPDKRFVLEGKSISKACNGFTDLCWLFLDVKSVGPRDDQDHAVMSHNQISGDGKWLDPASGVVNRPLLAKGQRTSHKFYCAIPPLYVLSNDKVVPVVEIVVKPVYRMLNLETDGAKGGQPLNRISVVSIPNGLLLTENPNYLRSHPGLFFPGKDDKAKDPKKMRARVSFEILRQIGDWRVRTVADLTADSEEGELGKGELNFSS